MAGNSMNEPILVAIDGSYESLAALDWSIDFARTRGHRLRVVAAARPVAAPASDSAGSYHLTTMQAEEQAVRRVRSLTLGTLKRSGLTFDYVVAVGPIDAVLARHSTDAALAVVGTRAVVGWRRLLRRSATKRLTGRLSCPLVSITTPSQLLLPASPKPSSWIAADALTAQPNDLVNA